MGGVAQNACGVYRGAGVQRWVCRDTGVLRDGCTEMEVQRDRMYKETGCTETRVCREDVERPVNRVDARGGGGLTTAESASWWPGSADSTTPAPRQARRLRKCRCC